LNITGEKKTNMVNSSTARSSVITLSLLCASLFEAESFSITSPRGIRSTHDVHTNLQMAAISETNPRLEGLAFDLDDGTRRSHSVAQNSSFVSGFFRGLSTREAYSKLLTSLYFVYTAMEDTFDSTSDDMVKKMDNSELRRVEALSVDMEYFYGAGWEKVITPSRAAKKYADRVLEVGRDQPKLLIAHQYTRYLGDLFGGQMMGGMATRSLNLEDGNGVAFYTFDDINSPKDFITTWYQKLNELDLTAKERQEIVDEANYVFELNIEILEELEGSALKAAWTLAWKSFREKMSF